MEKDLNPKYKEPFLFNIVVPVFNAENYIEKCLSSIIKQTYKNYKVQIVDDCSTDSTYEYAASICKNLRNFSLFRNSRRLGSLNNISTLLNKKIDEPSKTIDILIDGDDYLYSGDVLNILKEKYIKTNCLITYGSHLSSKGVQGKKYPSFIRRFNLFRNYFWYASHLKTFRHDLWLSIKPTDFLDKNGHFYSVASDLAIMFPMLEMAGNRQEFMDQVLYVYNDYNPISDHKIRRRCQIITAKEIRKKKKYNKQKFI